MITPDQAIFEGPEQDMSLGTAYANGGLAGVLGWLPLWNTIFLLTSSLTVHIAHLGLKNGNRNNSTCRTRINSSSRIFICFLQDWSITKPMHTWV